MSRSLTHSKHMMKLFTQLGALSAIAVILAFSQSAGAVTVGTQTVDIQDESRSRKLTSEIWFAADPQAKVQSFSPLPPLKGIEIAQ